MTLLAAVGQSTDFDGRTACLQAIEQAHHKIAVTGESVQLAFVFASQEYDLAEVLQTASVPLSNTPLLGFGSQSQLTQAGSRERSIVVALLAGGLTLPITVMRSPRPCWPHCALRMAAVRP